MHTQASDKAALILLARRFAWVTIALYAILIAGLWIAHALFPDGIGPVDAYSLSVSLIAAVTFGGLYASAMALWPSRSKEQTPVGAR